MTIARVFVPIATGTLAWVAVGKGLKLSGGPSSVAPEVVSAYAGTSGSVLSLGLIWAALASTMAALFNAVSGIFMNDVYQNFIRPHATDREVLRVGRVATVALAAITILIAWPKPLTLLTLLILLGVINTAYLAPIVLGLYYRSVNSTGVFYSVILGTVVGLLVFGSGSFDLLWFKIHVFDMPRWLGGELQGAVVSFIIATAGTVVSTIVRPQSFDMAKMRDGTREPTASAAPEGR